MPIDFNFDRFSQCFSILQQQKKPSGLVNHPPYCCTDFANIHYFIPLFPQFLCWLNFLFENKKLIHSVSFMISTLHFSFKHRNLAVLFFVLFGFFFLDFFFLDFFFFFSFSLGLPNPRTVTHYVFRATDWVKGPGEGGGNEVELALFCKHQRLFKSSLFKRVSPGGSPLFRSVRLHTSLTSSAKCFVRQRVGSRQSAQAARGTIGERSRLSPCALTQNDFLSRRWVLDRRSLLTGAGNQWPRLVAFSPSPPPFCRASFSGRLLRSDRAASQRVTGEEKLNFMPLIGERGWLPWKLIPLFSRQRCCLLIEDREKERLFIPDKKP